MVVNHIYIETDTRSVTLFVDIHVLSISFTFNIHAKWYSWNNWHLNFTHKLDRHTTLGIPISEVARKRTYWRRRFLFRMFRIRVRTRMWTTPPCWRTRHPSTHHFRSDIRLYLRNIRKIRKFVQSIPLNWLPFNCICIKSEKPVLFQWILCIIHLLNV